MNHIHDLMDNESLPLWGLNVSNRQIAQELGLNESDGQAMADLLRHGIFKRRVPVHLRGDGFHEVHVNTMEWF